MEIGLEKGFELRSNLWSFGKVFGWLSVTFCQRLDSYCVSVAFVGLVF